MRLHQCLILTCFGTIIPLCTGLKAVIFSINIGYSHVQFDAGLADLLVDAGHEAVSCQLAFVLQLSVKESEN